MSETIYVCIYVNTDHHVRDVEQAFTEREAAEAYCEQNLRDELVEADATHQADDYLYSNGIDDWGYTIERTTLNTGDADD